MHQSRAGSAGPDAGTVRPSRSVDRPAARAGAVAALAMLAVQLVWREWFAGDGAPSFPELIVAAVSRLTPLGLFGYATETFGSLAQNTLFVAVLVGIVIVGMEAGEGAARLAAGGRLGRGRGARIAAGLAVAAALLLVTLLAIVPIANLGRFARDSSRQTEVLVQLGSSFMLFGVVWGLLAARPALVAARAIGSGDKTVDRRTAIGRFAVGAGSMALLAAVGGAAWRLMRSETTVDRAASEEAAAEIRAAAEARTAGADVAVPTSAPIPRLEVAGAAAAQEPPPTKTEDRPTVDGAPLFAVLDEGGGLTPPLTSVADFYHVSKNIADPVVDGDGWTMRLDGLVDRPTTFDYEALSQRATLRKITTLGCISNEINGDLIGTAEWQGFPLRDLLVEAGVGAGAVDVVFRCSDDYEDSITIERAMDPDTLLVVGMNGEPLLPDHGYPARMIVPGIYGMKNVKWLTSIEVVDTDFEGYWQTRGWSDPAPYQIWGRIDLPESGTKLDPGPAVAAGVASAGDQGVRRVEVSLDDGVTWADAAVEPGINAPFTWVRWAFPFEVPSGKHEMAVRITDGTGEVAPEERRSPLPDGATGWPRRVVQIRDA